MIDIKEKNRCTGCSACFSVCPKACIEMKPDEEGFWYPEVDKTKCVSCGLCEKICPMNNELGSNDISTYTVAAQNLEQEIRKMSSAGGIVGAILSKVFAENGIAFATGFDENNRVLFFDVSSNDECKIRKIYSSKYTSSYIGDTFLKVKKELLSGRVVCFVGLPCQVAGLNSFLGRKYENLYLIDLTCYGVPSQKLYRKYLDYLENKYNDRITDVRFRDKTFGYSAPTMFIDLSKKNNLSQNSDVKSYLRCFFENLSSRPSCYSCHFKTVDRVSDFTIGDCKSIGKFVPDFDDDKGTTILYVHSRKGEQLIRDLGGNIRTANVSLEKILATSGRKMTESAKLNPLRDKFYAEIDTLAYGALIDKYCPATKKEKVVNIFKSILYATGLHNTKLLKKLKLR